MEPKLIYSSIIAEKVIQGLSKRDIDGHYFENSASLIPFLKELIPSQASVTWGGSMTLKETGVIDFLRNGDYKCLDRETADTPEKLVQLYREAFFTDFYFTGTNALTIDGKLVNIDGTGNRIAAMSYGPKTVVIITGSNKIVQNTKEAISRIRNYSGPVNAMRLNKDLPCVKSGKCSSCLEPGCICSHTIITRRSPIKGRIKVLIVGENLGY